LEPYAVLIDEGLADAIMAAHVFHQEWDESDPATLSPAVITDILRGEMGYTGVVISDDLQMAAIREFYKFEEVIRKSVEAGVDVIAIANNSVYEEDVFARGVEAVKRLVSDGIITRARIQESYQRIQTLKSGLL
jgi:beta-N-acetylhexosaminidase